MWSLEEDTTTVLPAMSRDENLKAWSVEKPRAEYKPAPLAIKVPTANTEDAMKAPELGVIVRMALRCKGRGGVGGGGELGE